MIEDCTAIILAGGDSQRMGRDKAALQLGDQTLLQRVTAKMQAQFPRVIISVRQPRPDVALPQVSDEQAGPGMRDVGGPLAGVAAGLANITTPWAFVVACDMPFIESALIELLARYREDYQAVVPVVQGYRQTLAAFYARSCLETIRAHLADGGRSNLRAVLEKLRVRYPDEAELAKADPGLRSFFDLDTPEDVVIAKRGF